MARKHKKDLASNIVDYTPIVLKNPNSYVAQQYQKILAKLELSEFDKSFKKILVSSNNANEGKTSLVSNLGMLYAKSGYKTLVIDFDLRKPTLHKSYNLTNDVGITDLLLNKKTLEEVTHSVSDNLSVITTGKKIPFPDDFFKSFESLEKFFTLVSQEYDKILADTAPVGLFSDGLFLSKYTDGMFLVIESKKHKKPFIKSFVEELEKNHIFIIGSVLNKVNQKSLNDYNNYYYSYYNYEDKKAQ